MSRNFRIYALLFISSLLLYVSFMSIGLDYFDSFEYAFALERWETALIHVHPPSYPIYVYVAKAIQIIAQDTRLALTLFSAISSAVGIVLVALVTVPTGNRRAGLIAGLTLLFLPGYWLSSEIALGDIPGTTFTLAAMVPLLFVGRKYSTRYFFVGCLLAAISLGVRPQNGIPVAMAGLVAIVNLYHATPQFTKNLILGCLAGCLGIALWVIPIYQTFDGYNGKRGFDAYIERLDALREHNESTDSLLSDGLTVPAIRERFDRYMDGWIHLITARSTRAFVIVAILMLIGLLALPFRHKFTWFVILWFVAEFIKVFAIASLERPRLYLPALIPLIILVSLGYSNLRGRLKVLRIGSIGLVLIFLWVSFPLVQQLNEIPPPPEQATTYILEEYPIVRGTSLVVSQGSFQAAQYHLADYQQLYTPYFDADNWSEIIQSDQPDYLIILDGDDIAPEIFDALTSGLNYVPIDDRVFERDPRVFPQHSTVRVQILTQEKNLQPEQLQLPADGIIHANNPSHGKYFGEGWYRIEDIGGTPGRWANQTVVLRASLPHEDIIMAFVASPYEAGQAVEISVNNTLIDTLEINEVWGTYKVSIPAESLEKRDIATIELHHTLAIYPENHNRRLATAYRDFTFTR